MGSALSEFTIVRECVYGRSHKQLLAKELAKEETRPATVPYRKQTLPTLDSTSSRLRESGGCAINVRFLETCDVAKNVMGVQSRVQCHYRPICLCEFSGIKNQ